MGTDAVTISKRVVWLDVAKGIAMFIVIFGHAIRDEMRTDNEMCMMIFRAIYLFHMDLFFFLSGYAYKLSKKNNCNKSIGEFVIKKAKTLLVPWLVYSMLIYVVFFIVSKIPQAAGIVEGTTYEYMRFDAYVLAFISGHNPYAYHMWFIYLLFWMSVIVFVVERILKDSRKTVYVLLAISIIGLLLRAFVVYDSIRLISGFCGSFIWFYLGVVFDEQLLKKYNWKMGVFSVISFIMMFVMHNYYYDYQTQPILRGFMMLPVNVFVGGVVIGFVKLSEYISQENNIIKRGLEYMGKNTMAFYLIHQQLCCAVLGLVLYNKMHLPIPVVMLACIVASLIVPVAIVYIAKKLKMGKVLQVLFAIK